MECLTKNSILLCSENFMEVSGGAESTLGYRLAKDARFFAKLRDGKTITLTTARNVLDWFADNWPDNAQRPNCLLDHMALRQWEAANEYSCQANQPVPRIVVPCLSSSELIDGYCCFDCKMSKLTEVGRGSKVKSKYNSCCSEASLEEVVEQ